MEEDPQLEVEHDELHRDALLELFQKHSFKERCQRVIRGLKAPKDSGDYKYAKLQMIRLASPISAVLVPVIGIGLLALLAGMTPEKERLVEVQVVEPETLEELEDIEDLMDEPIEPPEPIDLDFTSPDFQVTEDVAPPVNQEVSAQPATFDAVAMVKSPVIMKGIYGSRSAGRRGAAMRQFGGSGVTEGAVLRALRWLKQNQNKDGSWDKYKPAMTSLALLTFLAHGETSASEEFGETVQKAIRYLVDNQMPDGRFKGHDPHNYTQPIATYALCEAYALTRIPMVKEAAEKSILRVLKGQNPSGGFNYNLRPSDRNDTSYMGWCAQALKAAKMANIKAPGLKGVISKAIEGFKLNAHAAGGFGYTGPARSHGLTGVGVLCMQLLGAANDEDCKKGIVALEQAATFKWAPEGGGGRMNKNYYWYYITQAKFHHGGPTWEAWNDKFAIVLVKNQTIIEDAIEDPSGKLVDAGWWDMPKELSGATDGPVMNTCLCALQLQVYYRYLPTFKTPEATDEEVDIVSDNGDIEIDIEI